YIGSAVFGLHMPVWSVLIALALITAFAVQMLLWGDARQNRRISLRKFPALRSLAVVFSLYIVLLAAINTASVFVQCGLGQC
ncbi:disulfide bond formation protein DsbB, partial [Ochrobactrum sp. MR34]|nr:disulfide bond formation protein DsbB [Ochrobactrum sp. MR34]